MFTKNKIINEKSTKKPLASSILIEDMNTTDKAVEKKSNKPEKKKKKKRNLYAGLNPLVFKNRNKN